jgi:hypothetical protein
MCSTVANIRLQLSHLYSIMHISNVFDQIIIRFVVSIAIVTDNIFMNIMNAMVLSKNVSIEAFIAHIAAKYYSVIVIFHLINVLV